MTMNNDITQHIDGVSIVIPTYNRCHYQDDERNPLMWCISSIKQQTHENIEIIIVDDASTDNTNKKMKNLLKKHTNNIKYVQNKKRKGSSVSRNIGVDYATKELVLFFDDDCVFMNTEALASAVYAFNKKKHEGNNIAAMHLPVYYRSNRSKDTRPVHEILGIDYENARINCNTSSFPTETNQSNTKHYFKDTNILKPLEVNNLRGVFLCSRQAYIEVGGFPDYFPTPSLGEEHKLAQKFTNNGYKLYFSPDPKSALLHFKYGREDKEQVMPLAPLHKDAVEFPLSLKEMVDESRHVKRDTGNAVTTEESMYSYVFGRSMIFGSRTISKRKFKKRVKNEIIKNNRHSYANRKLYDRELREKICLDAISAAETKSREMTNPYPI